MSTMLIASKESLLVMLILFLGYMLEVYNRELVTYLAPVIIDAEHLESSDLGLISSSQKLGYTVIKIVGGAMVDVLDSGLVFSASLVLTGVAGICFTGCATVSQFSLTWFIGGLVQGPSWPALAVLLRQNTPGSQFSLWWSVMSASSNVASSFGPLVSQSLNSVHGWRTTFIMSGIVAIIFALAGGAFLSSVRKKKEAERGVAKEGKKSSLFSVGPLLNPVMLVVCLDYFLLSVVRGACNDWSQHYIIQGKKQAVLTGSKFISSQEIGGLIGSVVAGYMSDGLSGKNQHHAMPRLKTQFLFSVLLTLGLCCLIFLVSPESSLTWIHTVGFSIGFSLYGCITLIGIVCMDLAPSHLAGTSLSFGTMAGNLGRVFAGYPLAVIASSLSWHESFLTTLFISAMSAVICFVIILMVRRSHQTEAQKKES